MLTHGVKLVQITTQSRARIQEMGAQNRRRSEEEMGGGEEDTRSQYAASSYEERGCRTYKACKVRLKTYDSRQVVDIHILTECFRERNITLPGGEKEPLDAKTQAALDELRTPLNIRAINLRPLRRAPEHGIPVCDLQLRTYSIRNLLLFADFAMRAAYYMGLPARGPVPLPRITERWTVPRANFVFKKSQENFERITMRRLIQIQDGHPDVVKAWLAFLAKHQYYGVGMKANVWEYESLDSALGVGHEVKEGDYEGRREREMLEKVSEILQGESYQSAMKGYQAPEELERTRP